MIFIPKYRRKKLYGELRKHLGDVFRNLATQKESRIQEGHLMPDHVHMLISIPPKYAVSQMIGFIKGKSAIHVARDVRGAEEELRRDSTFGHGDTSCRRWAGMRKRSGTTSTTRKPRISAWTRCGSELRPP